MSAKPESKAPAGGGSRWTFGPQLSHDVGVRFDMKRAALVFLALVVISFAFRFWRPEQSLPVANRPLAVVTVTVEQSAREDFVSRMREIIARANSSVDTVVFGKTTIVPDNSINAPPLLPIRVAASD